MSTEVQLLKLVAKMAGHPISNTLAALCAIETAHQLSTMPDECVEEGSDEDVRVSAFVVIIGALSLRGVKSDGSRPTTGLEEDYGPGRLAAMTADMLKDVVEQLGPNFVTALREVL